MTTRRRIICSILSAGVLSACALFNHATPERVVRVKLLADVAFRARNPEWQSEARGLIEATSDYYEREFNIRLVSQNVAAWPERERMSSTPQLLSRLQKDFSAPSADYDVIVAFSGENVSRYLTAGRPRVDRVGECIRGLSQYMIVPTAKIFRYGGLNREPEPDVITLIHEFGHVFGAEHVDDNQSLMHENYGYRTEFDAKNRAAIVKNKFCLFAK
ncbi:MAG: matrixin family metalloprotease [Deltaproteobacteria bacterium]|nr:matrixin family metalloprotease [Deltaproteobacteria bacterium]